MRNVRYVLLPVSCAAAAHDEKFRLAEELWDLFRWVGWLVGCFMANVLA